MKTNTKYAIGLVVGLALIFGFTYVMLGSDYEFKMPQILPPQPEPLNMTKILAAKEAKRQQFIVVDEDIPEEEKPFDMKAKLDEYNEIKICNWLRGQKGFTKYTEHGYLCIIDHADECRCL